MLTFGDFYFRRRSELLRRSHYVGGFGCDHAHFDFEITQCLIGHRLFDRRCRTDTALAMSEMIPFRIQPLLERGSADA